MFSLPGCNREESHLVAFGSLRVWQGSLLLYVPCITSRLAPGVPATNAGSASGNEPYPHIHVRGEVTTRYTIPWLCEASFGYAF
jgi:hypothetical protein